LGEEQSIALGRWFSAMAADEQSLLFAGFFAGAVYG
jgi:hypothetical protein